MGQERRLELSEVGPYRVSAFSTAHLAIDGVSSVQSGSVEVAVDETGRALRIGPIICSLPRGVAPLGSSAENCAIWLKEFD